MKGETKPNKKLLLLKTLHRNTPLLTILTESELQEHQPKIHVIVFGKGQCLAKQSQPIDYIGVIIEGTVHSTTQKKTKGDTIGIQTLIGLYDKHPLTLTSQTQGLVLAIRIQDIFKMTPLCKTKFISQCTILFFNQPNTIFKTQQLLQQKEQKQCLKRSPAPLLTFLNLLQEKERKKFHLYFPYLGCKQRDKVADCTYPSYLLMVIAGTLIAKQKDAPSHTISAGQLYNENGMMSNCSANCNIYCQSSQAIFVLVLREHFVNHFMPTTVQKLFQTLCNRLRNSKVESNSNCAQLQEWSIFKKYQIVPLERKKQHKIKNIQHKNTQSMGVYQTFFKEQFGEKNKTQVSDKVYSLKTQAFQTESSQIADIEKYKKIIEELNEKIIKIEKKANEMRLKLIVQESKNNMNEVFKQIKKRRKDAGENIDVGIIQQNQKFTLKQALQAQAHSRKIELLVARCAKKWLARMRERKQMQRV